MRRGKAARAIHGHAVRGDVVVIENAATGYRRKKKVGGDGRSRAPQTRNAPCVMLRYAY